MSEARRSEISSGVLVCIIIISTLWGVVILSVICLCMEFKYDFISDTLDIYDGPEVPQSHKNDPFYNYVRRLQQNERYDALDF